MGSHTKEIGPSEFFYLQVPKFHRNFKYVLTVVKSRRTYLQNCVSWLKKKPGGARFVESSLVMYFFFFKQEVQYMYTKYAMSLPLFGSSIFYVSLKVYNFFPKLGYHHLQIRGHSKKNSAVNFYGQVSPYFFYATNGTRC